MATERDPLLSAQDTAQRAQDRDRLHSAVGPLEISQSTRHAVLAGLWSATFLSVRVSRHAFRPFFSQSSCLAGFKQYVLSLGMGVVLMEFIATLVATRMYGSPFGGQADHRRHSASLHFIGVQQVKRSELAGNSVMKYLRNMLCDPD